MDDSIKIIVTGVNDWNINDEDKYDISETWSNVVPFIWSCACVHLLNVSLIFNPLLAPSHAPHHWTYWIFVEMSGSLVAKCSTVLNFLFLLAALMITAAWTQH